MTWPSPPSHVLKPSPIRKTAFGFIWVVEGNAGKLKAEGALGSYRDLPISPTIAGCVAVVDAKAAEAFGCDAPN